MEKVLQSRRIGAEWLGGIRVGESKCGSEVEGFKGDGGGLRGFKRDVVRRVVEEKGGRGRREGEALVRVRMRKLKKKKRRHFQVLLLWSAVVLGSWVCDRWSPLHSEDRKLDFKK